MRIPTLFGLLASLCLAGCQGDSDTAHLELGHVVLDADLPRYGLNLGGSGTWGAEQLRANVLANPGFEGVLDRTVLVLAEATSNKIVDDTHWLARPDGFWTGATFDVRSGAAAGQSGQILDSRKRAGDGLGEFWLESPLTGLRTGDVVTLTKKQALQPAPHWWIGKGRVANAADDPRPDSPGQQSVRLMAVAGQPAEVLHYLDNIGDRAGKLLPVRGKWRLAFWARAATPGARLHVHFDRARSRPFLDADITPEAEWKRYEFEFEPQDDGPPGVLTLGLMAQEGEVRLDDIYLGEAETGAGGFRQAVVITLKTLRPGYLRDWQGQLGDTLANRLADEFGHRPARYRPGGNETQFHYGLPDFMALCAEIGARPWVLAPTTLDDAEWRAFGAWLHQAADRHGFPEILVEFGNENWNAIFRPGGIPDAATHAAVADRAFRLLKEGAGHDPRIKTLVNAQFVNPDSPGRMGALSREADRVAVAPYFLYTLEADTQPDAARQAAFAEGAELIEQETQNARSAGKGISVYEVNFHTTLGSASAEQRNAVVTSAASGPALARRLMQATLAGVREQAVYSLAGFDSYVEPDKKEARGLVRLWGITRDLTEANRLRPTGLALELLNRIVAGPAQAVRCEGGACPGVTAISFDHGKNMALTSAHATATTIVLNLPCPSGQIRLSTLDGSQSDRNNEDGPQVASQDTLLACIGDQVSFRMPPHSLAVLKPPG